MASLDAGIASRLDDHVVRSRRPYFEAVLLFIGILGVLLLWALVSASFRFGEPRNVPRREHAAPLRALSKRSTARSSTEALRHTRIGGYYPRWWGDLLRAHDYRCFYCGKRGHYVTERLHQEHAIPLARGGAHHVSNIVPACGSCNFKKGTGTGEEFLALLAAATVEREPPAQRGPTLQEQLRQALRRLQRNGSTEAFSVAEILDEARRGGSTAETSSLRATLPLMASKGVIERVSRGRYRLPRAS